MNRAEYIAIADVMLGDMASGGFVRPSEIPTYKSNSYHYFSRRMFLRDLELLCVGIRVSAAFFV